jgi:hypothetical protein
MKRNDGGPVELFTDFRIDVFMAFLVVDFNATLRYGYHIIEINLADICFAQELNATELV